VSAATLLTDVLVRIREGNTPDPEEFLAIDERVREDSSSLSKPELRELLGLVGEVQEALYDQRDAVRQELDRLQSERKALRGYAQLRSHRHSQRINRKT
jgi:hypothetical protein